MCCSKVLATQSSGLCLVVMAGPGDSSSERTKQVVPLSEICSTMSEVVKEIMAELKADNRETGNSLTSKGMWASGNVNFLSLLSNKITWGPHGYPNYNTCS